MKLALSDHITFITISHTFRKGSTQLQPLPVLPSRLNIEMQHSNPDVCSMQCTNSSAFRINFCILQTSVYTTANWFHSVVTLRGLPILSASELMNCFARHLNTSLAFSVIYCVVSLGMASIDISELCHLDKGAESISGVEQSTFCYRTDWVSTGMPNQQRSPTA
jgi:hypothetical protein